MNGKADMLVLGHIITMDDHKPCAEAMAVRDGKILYVGAAEVAKKLCDGHTEVFDYGENSVYPGFLEAHCHPGAAGYKMNGTAVLDENTSLEECVQAMKKYMEAWPDEETYQGMGFGTTAEMPKAAMLDAICPAKVMVLTSVDGHSMWINTVAMQKFGINREAVEKWGTDCVGVDEDGNPTGFLSEGPVFYIRSLQSISVQQMKTFLQAWEKHAVSNGYTGVYNAGAELMTTNEPEAYYELEKEGKLMLYTFSGSLVQDNTDTPEEDMARIAETAREHNSQHYQVIGAKVFCDGVIEAHTAWMLDDYDDQPGYKGVSRFDDHEKMVRLLKAACNQGMNVHVHTIGDAAVKAWVDAIAEAEEATGNFDMRNALAHLQVVREEDVKRFGDYNIMAVTGMMWAQAAPGGYEQELAYVGDRARTAYPIKSFIDSGAVVTSHTDFPVSPVFSVPLAFCIGVQRYLPSKGKSWLRNEDQCISRKDALKAMTTNVAYMWHAEDRMGSLEIGKLANFTVFNKDFMKDDLAEVENAKCLATFVDGKQVYKA